MRLLDKIFKKDDNFGIIVCHNNILDIEKVQQHSQILRLNIDNLIKPKPLLTQADPFLFIKCGTLFLFYESQRSGERGVIRMMKTTDLHNWSSPVTVLQESFHLSFPFVFEYNGNIYMIPESQEADSIKLYKGNDSLTKFKFERNLITKTRTDDINFNYCDSHLLNKDGIFYLFTSVAYNWTYHLELYYTDDFLRHDFVKHPRSPIYIGNDFGRSGGSIIHLDDSYYRISQRCNKSYGENVSVHRIKVLNENEFLEEMYLRDIFNLGGKIYHDGGHQLNIVKYGSQYIYATDYRHASWCWYQLYIRVKNLLKSTGK